MISSRVFFPVVRVRSTLEMGRWMKQHGFTLVELMITVAIVAILATLAVPSFNEVALSSKLNSVANNFVASAHLARSEAIKRNDPVTLCASANGTNCGGTWNDGWVVLAGGAVIHSQAGIPRGFLLSGDVTSLTFQATGVGATSANLSLCRSTPTVGSQKRTITVSPTGRPGVLTEATSSCA